RAEPAREEAAVDADPRVREREERHDRVARPGVPELLEELVARRRRAELRRRRARELGRRLLAELAEALGRPLEAWPLHRERVREDARREADHHRLDARLQESHPGARPEDEVDGADVETEAAQHERA